MGLPPPFAVFVVRDINACEHERERSSLMATLQPLVDLP